MPDALDPIRTDVACAAHPVVALRQTLIEPRRGIIPIDWRELSEHRELLYFLIWRDIKIRYKQTVLGVAWAVLQPVLSMLIFSVIFGRFAGIPSDGFPYPVFVFAGLLPWTFFSISVTQASQSLLNQQHLLTKVYLPRLFMPAASVGGALIDLFISIGVYALLMLYYRFLPGWDVLWVPALVLLTILASLGLSFLLAALIVSYRDFRYVVPFMMQILMYLSPVVYPVSLIPAKYHWLLALNPMTGIIEGYRSSILGRPLDIQTFVISMSSTLVLLLIGVYYFRSVERRFADIA